MEPEGKLSLGGDGDGEKKSTHLQV
jgi:hypothetical protein